jgi:hypothetical protein
MSGLPDFLKVPEGTAKLSLPPADMPVLKLIKFNLPPLHKATAFAPDHVKNVNRVSAAANLVSYKQTL